MAAEQDRTELDDNVDLPEEHTDDLTEADLEAEVTESDADNAADSDTSESDIAKDEASDEANTATDAGEPPEEAAKREAEERLLELFQSTVYGTDGQKLGRVGQVYLDDQTQEPNWVTVKTGFFGIKEYFVPLDLAERDGKRITVPYTKDLVVSAPRTEIDQNLSPAEEDDLYAHYQVPGKQPEPDPLLVDSADAAASEPDDEVNFDTDLAETDEVAAASADEAADDATETITDAAFAPDSRGGGADATTGTGFADDADAELDATSLNLETDPEIEKPAD